MLEGKALVVAIMMLTAAPIAATDSGQIFIEDVRNNVEKMLSDEEPAKVTEIIDDSELDESDRLEEDTDVPCFTFEEWKERYSDEEKVDEVKAVESKENKNDRARGDDDRKEDDKKEDYYDKEDWADKETVSKYDDCLTDDEWTLKFESDKDESCFTFGDLEAKKWDETKYHNKGWDRIHYDEDKTWDREDNDWDEDEEFRLYLEELSNACDEGEDEACDELLVIREELAEDRDEERNEDGRDEERNEEDREEERNEEDREEKDWDEDACLTMEEWREVLGDDKKERYNDDWDDEKICIREDENGVIHYDCGDDRKEKGPHRDAFVRVMLAELEYACEEENNEEACAELEEIVAEFEEREGECNKERDDEEENDESNEDDEWDENDEDESDDGDESDEDNSEE